MRRDRRGHVLVIVENVSLARDHRLRKQVTTLAGAGLDVTVICRRDAANHRTSGVRILEYPPPPELGSKLGFVVEYGYSFVVATLFTLLVLVRRRVDVLQVCGAPDIYVPLAWAVKVVGVRVVYDQRDPSPELFDAHFGAGLSPVRRLLVALERATFRCADRVVVVNESLRRIARERGGVEPERITIVGNGPVLARTEGRAARPELRRGFGALACWVGLMGPQDAVEEALRAISHLVHDHGERSCLFVFIGDGERRRACEALAAELGVEPVVHFAGWLPEDEVFEYLATADLGLEPNLQDLVSPVKVMEYLAFGLPVVAFDVEETRALAGDAARYAPPGDHHEFAHQVSGLLADPEQRRRLGDRGRARVATTIAWDHQAPAYLDAVTTLIKERQRSRRAPWSRGGRTDGRTVAEAAIEECGAGADTQEPAGGSRQHAARGRGQGAPT